MVGHVLTTGAALLLLLAALPTARTYDVTWSRCKEIRDWGERVLGPGSTNYEFATALNLFNCNINTLHVRAFNGLPRVEYIYLENNIIESINVAVFSPVRNITYLHLASNRLREVPNFGEHSLFPRMVYLNLSNNTIRALSNPNTFSACGQLRELDLHVNQIEYVHVNFFEPLKSLNELYLHFNRIKNIPDTMFNIKSLRVLDLTFNSIEYVSPRAFRGCELTDLRLYHNRITQLPVNFVSELKRAGAKLQWFTFYDNPWNCACLLEQLADVKRAGVQWWGYQMWWDKHYIGDKPECMFTGRYPCLRRAPSWLLPPPPSSPARTGN